MHDRNEKNLSLQQLIIKPCKCIAMQVLIPTKFKTIIGISLGSE